MLGAQAMKSALYYSLYDYLVGLQKRAYELILAEFLLNCNFIFI